MQGILMSVLPEKIPLITSGKKTVLIKKTRPKLETPFKVYIYCTKKEPLLKTIDNTVFIDKNFADEKNLYGLYQKINCKVIGEFVCDKIYEIGYDYFYPCGYEVSMGEISRKELYEKSCLSFNQIDDYLNMELGYGWHISNLVIYDKPRELGEFKRFCDGVSGKIGCKGCEYYYEENDESQGHFEMCGCDNLRPITRPPQSWCYVKEHEE